MSSSSTSERVPIRRIAALILLAALGWFGVRPIHARFLAGDQARWRTMLERFPDRHFPGYREFILGVLQRTPPAASVAISFPTLSWEEGYSYAYFRADYLLDGRRVIPLALPEWTKPERVDEADYVAAWQTPPPTGDWRVVWQGEGGTLLRRAR